MHKVKSLENSSVLILLLILKKGGKPLFCLFKKIIFEGLEEWLTAKSSKKKKTLAILVQLLLWECDVACQKPGLL